MQTKTKEPLYKRLNKERTQGEVELRSNKMFFKTGNGYNSLGLICIQKPYDSLARPIVDTEAIANAEYTVLAVNNLSVLAEALEELNNAICGDVFSDDEKTQRLLAARQKAKEALNKISKPKK